MIKSDSEDKKLPPFFPSSLVRLLFAQLTIFYILPRDASNKRLREKQPEPQEKRDEIESMNWFGRLHCLRLKKLQRFTLNLHRNVKCHALKQIRTYNRLNLKLKLRQKTINSILSRSPWAQLNLFS